MKLHNIKVTLMGLQSTLSKNIKYFTEKICSQLF